jgi:FkbM family methyltransferase
MPAWTDPLARQLRKLGYRDPLGGFLFGLTRRTFEADGCRFAVPLELTDSTFRSRFLYDLYENEERALVGEVLRPDDRVLELGGCIGVVSCIVNRRLTRPDSRHVVVEANPYLIPYLYRNRELNGCSFLIEHCAIGAGSELTFYLDQEIVQGSAQRSTGRPVRVPARGVDDLAQKHGPFNVLIMDIQGGEIGVLDHPEVLAGPWRLVMVEWHPAITGSEAIEQSGEVLRAGGFTLTRRIEHVETWERPVRAISPSSERSVARESTTTPEGRLTRDGPRTAAARAAG